MPDGPLKVTLGCDQTQAHDVVIDHTFSGVLEVDRDAAAHGGLDLARPPVRLTGMADENAGDKAAGGGAL